MDEKMAFGQTTESFASREEVRAFLDLHGGIWQGLKIWPIYKEASAYFF